VGKKAVAGALLSHADSRLGGGSKWPTFIKLSLRVLKLDCNDDIAMLYIKHLFPVIVFIVILLWIYKRT